MRPPSGMPRRNMPQRLETIGSPVAVADVLRVYVEEGRLLLEVVEPQTGQRIDRVPVMVHGGIGDSFVVAPPEPPLTGRTPIAGDVVATAAAALLSISGDDRVQAVLLRRWRQVPLCIGVIQHVEQALAETVTRVFLQGEDHSGAIDYLTFAVRKRGALCLIDSTGAVVCDVTAARDGNVRFQLRGTGDPEGAGVVRISRGGEASERFPLAGPLFTKMQEMIAAINNLIVWAASVDVFLYGIDVNESTGDMTQPTLLPYTNLAVPGNQVTLTTPEQNAIKAAAVHVSSDNEVI